MHLAIAQLCILCHDCLVIDWATTKGNTMTDIECKKCDGDGTIYISFSANDPAGEISCPGCGGTGIEADYDNDDFVVVFDDVASGAECDMLASDFERR